jgi:hypothetical protein
MLIFAAIFSIGCFVILLVTFPMLFGGFGLNLYGQVMVAFAVRLSFVVVLYCF